LAIAVGADERSWGDAMRGVALSSAGCQGEIRTANAVAVISPSPLVGEGGSVLPHEMMGEGAFARTTPHPFRDLASPLCPLPQGERAREATAAACPSCFETPRHGAWKEARNALEARLRSMRASGPPLPLIPAKAGIQGQRLGPGFRGDERMLHASGWRYALAFACAMNARQPPKAEMSRAPCVGAGRYPHGTRSRFELVSPSVLSLQAASVFLTKRQS